MVDSCYKKCIATSYIEAELNKGESVCTDRCISKYFQVSTMVNNKFTANNAAVNQ